MLKFLVTEIQTNDDGTVGTLLTTFDERNLAESKFHTVLAAAAVSGLPMHAATITTNGGVLLDRGCYINDGGVLEDTAPEFGV